MKLEISKIVVGDRVRKELGDLKSLTESIQKVGLLQAIGVTLEHELVFGGRRLSVAKSLGWQEIEVKIVNCDLLVGERDENECRKDFTPVERIAIAALIREKEAGRVGNPNLKSNSEQLRVIGKGETRTLAAEAAGFGSKDTLERAERVVRDGAPELVEAMDKEKVSIYAASQISRLPLEEQVEELRKKLNPPVKDEKVTEKPKVVCNPDPLRMYQEGMTYSAASLVERARSAIVQISPKDPNALQELNRLQSYLTKHIDFITGAK